MIRKLWSFSISKRWGAESLARACVVEWNKKENKEQRRRYKSKETKKYCFLVRWSNHQAKKPPHVHYLLFLATFIHPLAAGKAVPVTKKKTLIKTIKWLIFFFGNAESVFFPLVIEYQQLVFHKKLASREVLISFS